ncbi:hypothetical protein M0804_007530 [Polistes exclamans]|nr:hypothetical protein M0804_007530 [Polistes exclamans]
MVNEKQVNNDSQTSNVTQRVNDHHHENDHQRNRHAFGDWLNQYTNMSTKVGLKLTLACFVDLPFIVKRLKNLYVELRRELANGNSFFENRQKPIRGLEIYTGAHSMCVGRIQGRPRELEHVTRTSDKLCKT